MAVFKGDEDNIRLVNILDQSFVKIRLFKNPLDDPTSIQADVRTDGIVNLLDQSDTKFPLQEIWPVSLTGSR